MPITMTSSRSRRCGLTVGLCLVTILSGCSTPLRQEHMTIAPNPPGGRFAVALARAMCVRNVSGAEGQLTDSDFRDALVSSLEAIGLKAAPESCKYPVDVNILGIARPTFARDMTVTTHINYKVYDYSGSAVLLETVSAPFTATTSDASYGAHRSRLAHEGSVRESISRFLDKLRGVSL